MMTPELIVMRLDDMRRVHPQQDNSRTCDFCGAQVGIYPSGQEALKICPEAKLRCNRCYKGDVLKDALAPGALHELFESVDRKAE